MSNTFHLVMTGINFPNDLNRTIQIYGKSVCVYHMSDAPIRSQLRTYHNSVAPVPCAKLKLVVIFHAKSSGLFA